jgi:hypothetical protein
MADERSSQHGFSIAVFFCLGVGAVTTLLAATGLDVWRIKALIVVTGVSFSIAAILLANDRGWLRTSVIDMFPRLIVILALPWAIPICIGLRLMPIPHIRPFYQDSTFLTESRRDQISSDINEFYDYLVRVGFKIPPKTPTIGTRPGENPSSVGTYPGVDVQTAIFIPEDRIDDPAIVERQYGNVLFAEPFRVNDLSQLHSQSHYINLFASMLFSSYYVSSFNDRNTSPSGYKWGNALWNLRTRYGQQIMDSMMLAAFQTWSPTEDGPIDPTRSDFDSVFAQNLSYASSLLGKPGGEVDGILQVEGIRTRKPR